MLWRRRVVGRKMAENRKILIWGVASVDIVVKLAVYPLPDDKLRASQTIICGGGNGGNTSVALARLGLDTTFITKFGNDANGQLLKSEFNNEGVNIDFSFTSKTSLSPLTYVMVHESTRTCIHSPMEDEITSEELKTIMNSLNLTTYNIIHFDSRHTHSASQFASHVTNNFPTILLSIDLEKPRSFLELLLHEVHIIFTNQKALQQFFPNNQNLLTIEHQMKNFFLSSSSTPEDQQLTPKCLLVVCTLGDQGSLLLCRKNTSLFSPQKNNPSNFIPEMSIFSNLILIEEFEVEYYLIRCRARQMNGNVDTTGCGDAFIGGFLAALSYGSPLEICLITGTIVASEKMRGFGARSTLPTIAQLQSLCVESASREG